MWAILQSNTTALQKLSAKRETKNGAVTLHWMVYHLMAAYLHDVIFHGISIRPLTSKTSHYTTSRQRLVTWMTYNYMTSHQRLCDIWFKDSLLTWGLIDDISSYECLPLRHLNYNFPVEYFIKWQLIEQHFSKCQLANNIWPNYLKPTIFDQMTCCQKHLTKWYLAHIYHAKWHRTKWHLVKCLLRKWNILSRYRKTFCLFNIAKWHLNWMTFHLIYLTKY